MIVIVNYGMGNLGSILNMLKKIGAEAVISSEIHDIKKADKLVLPGVGSFDNGMKNITDLGLLPILNERVMEDRTPVLGICLGMQLFTKKGEEGILHGLGWIDAETIKFKFENNGNRLKIPHMGWNSIIATQEDALFTGLNGDLRFYFVHSYHIVCDNEEEILAKTHYGYDFVSSVRKENIFGVQFHPEKSHKFGMRILKNFVELI